MLGLPHGETALARGDYDTIGMTHGSNLSKTARLVPTRWILACLAALFAADTAFAQMVEARDLAADARQAAERRIPLLVLFSEAGCPWCARARQEFLLPMQRNPEYQSKVMMREVGIDNSAALVDFAGKTTTQAEFARSHRVLMVPTVALLGARGESLTEPLIGFRTTDYYGYFLDQRIDAALAQLRGSR
jgi:thioredoxin-related protein